MGYLNFRQSLRQYACVCVALAIATAPLLTLAQSIDDDGATALERRVKAAFIYKFIDYIGWPQNLFSQPDAPLTIAVMGDNQLADELSNLVADRTVNGRPIVVRKLSDINPSTVIQVLFVGQNESTKISQVTKALEPRPILIVTESEGALAKGSIINFMMIDGHVRFEIALDSAEKRGLKLSSRLLEVAQNVRSETP